MAGTDLERPSRGFFLLLCSALRLCIWPVYLYHVFASAERAHVTPYHRASVLLEMGLFLTNLHFLYKNVRPVWTTGRLLTNKTRGFHRTWLDRHPHWQQFAGLFLGREKISMDAPGMNTLAKDE